MIKIDPNAKLYDRIGTIYANMHKDDSATFFFKKSYEMDSLNGQLLLDYGAFNLLLKKNEEGLKYLCKISKKDKNYKEPLN